MKENLTELVAILDRSGSMYGLTEETIAGYNKFIAEQKELPGEANLTTILFDDQYDILHDGVPLREIRSITTREYYTRGSTALLDALGKTINTVGQKLAHTQEEERPGKVLFLVITDGYENASQEFSAKQIRKMVEHQREKYKWEFLFLGANIDAFATASSMGICHAYNYTADKARIGIVHSAMSVAARSFRKWNNILADEEFAVLMEKAYEGPVDKKKKK
jgi:uncharacterized protein YegL